MLIQSAVGFPIAVAAWLLVRIEQRIESLTSAICELREAIVTILWQTT